MDKPRSQQCLSLSDVVGVVRPWHGEGSETRRACRTPATAARTRTRAAKRASTCTERGGDGPACGRTRQGHASRPKTLRARKAPTSTSRPKTPTGRIAPTMACACAEQRTLAARSMAWQEEFGGRCKQGVHAAWPDGALSIWWGACADIQRPMSGARCGKAAAPNFNKGRCWRRGAEGRQPLHKLNALVKRARACPDRVVLREPGGQSPQRRLLQLAGYMTSGRFVFPSHLGGALT